MSDEKGSHEVQLARIEEHLRGIEEKLSRLETADEVAVSKSEAANVNRASQSKDLATFRIRVDTKLEEHENILERQNRLIWIVVIENAGVLLAIISLVIKLVEFMGGP